MVLFLLDSRTKAELKTFKLRNEELTKHLENLQSQIKLLVSYKYYYLLYEVLFYCVGMFYLKVLKETSVIFFDRYHAFYFKGYFKENLADGLALMPRKVPSTEFSAV